MLEDTLCFFDFEASSADAKTAMVIEAATATFSLDGRMLKSQSTVVQIDSIGEEITQITGLRKEHCDLGINFAVLYNFLAEGFGLSRFLVGHNILKYDVKLVTRLNFGERLLEGRHLIDTMFDIEFPQTSTSKKLTHLCSDRGIPTPNAHGALYDCIYTSQLFFSFTKEERDEIYKRAQTPAVYIKACVNYDGRDLAKKHKFRFDPETKTWWKQVRLYDRERIKAEVGNEFKIEILDNSFNPS